MNIESLENKKFTLKEVLSDSPEYLQVQALERLKKDLEFRNGDFRFSSLKALIELLELNPNLEPEISENLRIILEKTRGKIQEVGLTAEDNTEYDETLASMGRGSKDDGDDYDEEEWS